VSTMIAFLPLLLTLLIGIALTLMCLKAPTSDAAFAEDNNSKRLTGEFRGDTGEYVFSFFKVVLLNIITLGIYSPWGTVKLRKLLLNNTYIGNNSFDFHATPISILKGRLLIAGIFILIFILAAINQIAYAIALFTLIAIAPVLLHLGLKFKYRNHSFGGVRFEFSGKVGGAFKVTYGLLFGGITTLSLAVPVFSRFFHSYVLNNSKWGDRALGVKTKTGSFYGAYGKSILCFLGGIPIVLVVFIGISALISSSEFSIWHFLPLSLYLLLPVTFGIYRWLTFKVITNSFCIDRTANSECQLRFTDILKVVLVNFFGVILTLGIYYPWARLRAHRLLVGSITLKAIPSVSEIRYSAEKETSSVTDEIASTVYDLSL
jgi:uncharacterized membrane protein YjgN (DUF898 family)